MILAACVDDIEIKLTSDVVSVVGVKGHFSADIVPRTPAISELKSVLQSFITVITGFYPFAESLGNQCLT